MKIVYKSIIIAAATVLLWGCENWLDVKPQQQVDASVLFSREDGFKDALAGVYISLVSQNMYGAEMTFGLVDVIGGVYTTMGSTYTRAWNGEYDNPLIERMINNIWWTGYETIANLNNLIDHLKKADQSLFSPDNYNVILGEALALRAFIHCDLLRLFAPSYAADPMAKAIPYVTSYAFTMTPQYTVSGVLDSVMRDANAALLLLRTSDPIYTGREITTFDDDGYLLNRKENMNYYAVLGLMARVHLYRGEMSDAARCAQEVITSGVARWVAFNEVSQSLPETRDRTFSPEHIFALDARRLNEYVNSRIAGLSGSSPNTLTRLTFTQSYLLNTLYPYSGDWRRFLYRLPTYALNDNADYECIKYGIIGTSVALGFRNLLPLMRLPEMQLIWAEALLNTDPPHAAMLVNELVAPNRGFSAGVVAEDASVDTIREAILLEYRREFVAEGQMFFYHKRLDLPAIVGGPVDFNKSRYVLPMPQEEIEFGQRTN